MCAVKIKGRALLHFTATSLPKDVFPSSEVCISQFIFVTSVLRCAEISRNIQEYPWLAVLYLISDNTFLNILLGGYSSKTQDLSWGAHWFRARSVSVLAPRMPHPNIQQQLGLRSAPGAHASTPQLGAQLGAQLAARGSSAGQQLHILPGDQHLRLPGHWEARPLKLGSFIKFVRVYLVSGAKIWNTVCFTETRLW